ncbi:4-hydroxylaminobenzoate lyase [Streptomyces sp. NPDC003393]
MRPSGRRGAGWTAPGPGSHHCPEVRGGVLIDLPASPRDASPTTSVPCDRPVPRREPRGRR